MRNTVFRCVLHLDKGQETENLKKEFEFYLCIYILPFLEDFIRIIFMFARNGMCNET